MKIVVAVCVYAGMVLESVKGLIDALLGLSKRYNQVEIVPYFTNRVWLPFARLKCLEKAKNEKADYLMYVGEDIVLERRSIWQLIEYHKPVISGLYFGRKPPYNPLVHKRDKDGNWRAYELEELKDGMRVEAVGHDCLLMERKVFNRLDKEVYKYMTWNEADDLSLSRFLGELNIPMYLSTRVHVGHASEKVNVIDLKEAINIRKILEKKSDYYAH